MVKSTQKIFSKSISILVFCSAIPDSSIAQGVIKKSNIPSAISAPKSNKPASPADIHALNPQPLPPKASANSKVLERQVKNIGNSKIINFQKGLTKIDLENEADDTILLGPKGERISIGEIKRQQAQSRLVFTNSKSVVTMVDVSKNSNFLIKSSDSNKSNLPPNRDLNKSSNLPIDIGKAGTLNEARIEAIRKCENHEPPLIKSINGQVTPENIIKIYGKCFGNVKKEVRLYGSSIKGIIKLEISRWDEAIIVAKVPKISGSTEGEALLQVIDQKGHGSAGNVVNFVPTYTLKNANFFTGCSAVKDENNIKTCSASMVDIRSWEHTGVFEHAKYDRVPPIKEIKEGWALKINPACKLNSIYLAGFGGKPVDSFQGEITSRNTGYVRIFSKLKSDLEVHWYGDIAHYYGMVAVGANAYCPEGFEPFLY